tara:strand:+ start:471 stop:662 length:192 start_codon:yes stop_codon:yes gene_type:complete
MGSFISRAYNIILVIPIMYLIGSYVREKITNKDKKEDYEIEWGQFCDISTSNTFEVNPKVVTH